MVMFGCMQADDVSDNGDNVGNLGNNRYSTFTVFSSRHRGNRRRETPAERQKRKERERIGRDPNDNTGKELPYGAMARRTAAVCCFLAGGCIIKIGDDIYSWATKQPKGAAIGQENHPGLDDYSSSYISALFKSTEGNSLDKDEEHQVCYDIIYRFYANHDIFETSGDILDKNAKNLRNQLFKDITSRRYRKVMGERLVFWVQLGLAAFVSILAFTRGIVGDNEKTREQITIIGWIEGAAALATILLAQTVHKATIVDAEATAVLERLRRWVVDYVKEKKALEEQAKKTLHTRPFFNFQNKSEVERPIHEALSDLGYTILEVKNLDNSLAEAAAKIRSRLGLLTTLFQVHGALKNISSPANRVVRESDTDLLDEKQSDSPVEQLSRLYDCPVIVVSENRFEDNAYCKVFNETAPDNFESKEQESSPQQYQEKREERMMILYTPEAGFYHAVIPPADEYYGQRPYAKIISELKQIKPATTSTDTKEPNEASDFQSMKV